MDVNYFGTWRRLERTTGGCGGSPGPLEIETAQVPGDVDNFADEEQAWNGARFHGFAGELASVHATRGDFRFVVAFGSRRSDGPGVNLSLQRVQSGVAEGGRPVEFQPARGQAGREKFIKGRTSSDEVAGFGGAD